VKEMEERSLEECHLRRYEKLVEREIKHSEDGENDG
jgi:hypothetical protein